MKSERKKNQHFRWFHSFYPDFQFVFSDPGGIRTHDPQLRRLLLYPAELRGQFKAAKLGKFNLLTNPYVLRWKS
jgi:hypothetical protein